MTTRLFRKQQTHTQFQQASHRYDENANACEENQYPENMIDRFSCRTWQKHREGKQTLDNAETDTRSRSPTGAAQSTVRESEFEAPLRNLILFSRHLTENPTPVAVPVVVSGCVPVPNLCKPRSRWDRSTRWVNY